MNRPAKPDAFRTGVRPPAAVATAVARTPRREQPVFDPDFLDPPDSAPFVAHPDMPEDAIDAITGTRAYRADDVPLCRGGQPAAYPALELRASEAPGVAGRWYVVDYVGEGQRIALGWGERRHRKATGCAEADVDGAIAAFLAYAADKRLRLLARTRPRTIPFAAVALTYCAHLESGAHNLTPGSVAAYHVHLVPIAEYFAGEVLGAMTEQGFKRYETWRRKQTARGKTTPVSLTLVGHEIAAARQAINHFQKRTPLGLPMRYYMPKRDTPPVVWWTRDEIARYFWACRGRIAVVLRDAEGREVGWRWRVARDDDPRLTGPAGDRRVLRPRAEIAEREPEARRVRLGLYTASRAKALVEAAYVATSKQAYLSHVERLFRRKPIGVRGTSKRQPPIPAAPRLANFVVWWGRRDGVPRPGRRRPGTLLHKPDGTPCDVSWLSARRARVLADCGVDKPLHSNILRHTAAMWMKIENVSAWVAANFLGCRPDVLEERYGTWDMYSLYGAIEALTCGARQKQAAKQAAADGVALR